MSIAALALALLLLAAPAAAAPADDIVPRTLPVPPPTAWAPNGCRSVPFTHPVLPDRNAFRRTHGDLDSSDEVALAYPPVFAREWIAEPQLYQVTTPSFDAAGNLYMTPFRSYERILLLSLDGRTGERRFVLPVEDGDRVGGVVPMVLNDPDDGGEVIYVNAYDRIVAVRSDGTPVWSAPTGLGPSQSATQVGLGIAWVPNADAVVGLMRDGFVVLLDRRSGAPLLDAPYQLPGEKTPPTVLDIPAAVLASTQTLLEPLVDFSGTNGLVDMMNVLLGGSSEVANSLSVDGRTNRLWIAATAPDVEDGTIDGVSELGALYRIDVVRRGGAWALEAACHRNFTGGSASTPTLGANGTRIYLGDNVGALLSIDAETCDERWSVPLGAQVFGSVAGASDGREIYAATATGIFQVFDDDDRGRRGWSATNDVYDVPDTLSGYGEMNLLLTGAGANGLLTQVGVGLDTGGRSLPVRTGILHLDRATGRPRGFADGLEESLGAMSTGADGALYLPHAPLRRAFAAALGLTSQPLVGGVSKWSSTRDDLLARDAACAAAERAANARRETVRCADAARADAAQVDALRAQAHAAAGHAVAAATLPAGTLRDLRRADASLRRSPVLDASAAALRRLPAAERRLGEACAILSASSCAARGEDARSARCATARAVPGRRAGLD
jgi:outer membrane protein assembly factor BamB